MLRASRRKPIPASLIAAVNAGCQPVRVALSDHGALVWVTARGSDALLAFDAADLRTNPSHALRADVRGPQPVGVVLVADSARFTAPNRPQTLSVVDTRAALAGRPALIGTIPAAKFPREFGYDPVTGEVVLSSTVEVFASADTPPRDARAGYLRTLTCPVPLGEPGRAGYRHLSVAAARRERGRLPHRGKLTVVSGGQATTKR